MIMCASRKPLYLSETIERLNLDDLKRFAGLLGFASAQSSKARLIRDIPAALAAGIPDNLLEGLSSYPPGDLMIVLAFEECGDFLSSSTQKNALLYLQSASPNRHPLLVDFEGNGDLRVFAEFIPIARRLSNAISRPAPTKPPDTKAVLPPETLINDIFTIWAALSKKPIKLTKKDFPKKRHIDSLVSILLVDEDEPGLAAIQSYFGMSRFELLFEFMQKHRILRINENVLEANPVFISQSAPELSDIGRLLIEVVTNRESAATVALTVFVLRESDGWVSAADLTATLSGILPAYREAEVKRALFALFISGYVTIGRKGRKIVIRREREFQPLANDELWTAEPDIIIGSNFEVKVPANTEPVRRIKIEAFADLRKPDLFYDYEITKSSVYRALDDGVTADEIIDALKSSSKRLVPQNVEFAIHNWERQFGSIGFEKGLFLVTADKATGEELASLSEIIAGEAEVLNLYAIRLDENDYDRARGYLRQLGFLPRSLPRTVQPRGGEGNVSSLFRGYRIDSGSPIVAGVNQQTLLKRSIEFARKKGGKITLELRDGSTVYGKPISIKVSRGETVVRIDCGGEMAEVVLRDVIDFTLD